MINAKTSISEYKIEASEETSLEGVLNTELYSVKIMDDSKDHFILTYRDKLFEVTVIDFNKKKKEMELLVNGHPQKITLSDQYDRLIKSLGFGNNKSDNNNSIKAPMPGLVIDVLVSKGDEIKEGDKLIILEAMKMENILKSNSSGKIKSIKAEKGKTVDKNSILIELE